MKQALLLLKKGAYFFIFFVILLIVFGVFMYQMTAQNVQNQIGNQCLGISSTIAVMLEQDIDGYLEFIHTLDTQSDYYKATKKRLEQIRRINEGSIQFLYTEVKIADDEIMFILDGDLESSELFAPPGFTTPMTITRQIAYDLESAYVGETFTENAFGRLLSAYAPIRDKNGAFVGLVGVDISAEQYDAIMQGQLLIIVVSIGILILMMLVLGGRLVNVYEEKLRSDEGSASKSNFLARMSHEIRTPMNAIAGMTELILRDAISPIVRDHAINIRQASANLLAIINDILDFSKVESGKLEIVNGPYQFSSLINDVVSVIRMRIVDKHVRLLVYTDCHIPHELIGDEVRMRQILINVMANAAKFTEEGYVALHVESKIGKGENEVILTIKIIDTGIGIRQENLERLFDDFAQLDQKNKRNIEGTGLGLTITKNLCTLMGGDISVSSVYGEGSTFTITLPQRYAHYAPIAEIKEPDSKLVLLYETRGNYADYLVKTLKNLGVRGTSVSTHSDFLSELQTKTYTHVFVSSFLYESAKRIMAQLSLQKTTLILLSEYGESNALISGAYSLTMPAYAVSVVHALNDDMADSHFDEGEAKALHFIAPNARILVVDDIKANLKVTEGLLAPFQMIVDCAQSGSDAISLIKTNRYDLVMMDHMMPEMDGIEATENIRALGAEDAYFLNLPIVALTANAVSGVREMFIQNGMNDYLAKPIEVSKLHNIIEKWIPKEKQQKYYEEKTTAEKPTFTIEGIDTKVGLAMTGGTQYNYERVLETYYLDILEKKTEIQDALAGENIPLFTIYVHALKSASASVGALELSECAKKLESAGNQEDMAYIAENTPPFLMALSNVADAIIAALPHIHGNEAASAQEDGHILRELLLALQCGLTEINVEAIDKSLSALRAGSWTYATQQKISELDKLVLLFEYDSAAEIIDLLLK